MENEETKPWEKISVDYMIGLVSDRLKIPQGWIVRSRINHKSSAIHQIIVNDPYHEWIIDD
ncbi:hypothetical protein KJ603_01055 [Patescibacteria group bacterium]|nr:hypothetical protein [Patescibacteria group bacterium]